MKPLEKSMTLAVSLKVAVGNVKYVFNIDILVNQKQNNIINILLLLIVLVLLILTEVLYDMHLKKQPFADILQNRCY